MASKAQKENLLARYVLGGLSERERERLEEEYFEDDEAFEQMLIAEEDLIDAYVHDGLSEAERTQFEQHFLSSPEGCERVQFACALAAAVADARPLQVTGATDATRHGFLNVLSARGAALRFALAAAVLAAIVGIPWLLIERARMREELRQLRAEHDTLGEKVQEMERAAAEQARSAETPAQLEAGKAQPAPEVVQQRVGVGSKQRPPQANSSPRGQGEKHEAVIALHTPRQARKPSLVGTMDATLTPSSDLQRIIARLPPQERSVSGLSGSVSFDLTPGLVRGGGTRSLVVPDKATFVLLQLSVELNSSHESYRAVIETADGRTVWSADSVRPRRPAHPGKVIELPAVPARDLPSGDYILSLSGQRQDGSLESVADYSFRIVRK